MFKTLHVKTEILGEFRYLGESLTLPYFGLPLRLVGQSTIATVDVQRWIASGGYEQMPVAKTEVLTLEKLRRLAAGDEPAETHVMELLESMRSEDEEVRAWTSDALQTVEVLPKEMARNVADMCLQPSAAVSAAACRLLVKLGDEATQYQAAIVACLTQHQEITARQQAALALSSMAGLTAETLAALREAAESPDPRLKRLASNALNQAEA